jgi:error-prone DNA polymerase
MDTYRVRHAIRDVGAALGLPPMEIDAMAKAFPHISARNARHAIGELPELRASGLDAPRLEVFFELVERLDGLPRHIALHPCGVVLSNSGLLDRTPVEASWLGFPMSQFDKDDVETLGLLKLDILGIRMQSSMAHAVAEVERVDGVRIDLDDQRQVPLDDEATFRLIRTTHTLGCFQIESPGQRELVGKFGPQSFEDLVIDISLFRPGPVKSDMIVPFLSARNGWRRAHYIHPSLVPALAETEGVVVFHEQVLQIVAATTGVSLAQADEVRRALGTPAGQRDVERWWRPAARAKGYAADVIDQIWAVLKAFASFGFCKAHAAAFALPTYQSAWLKTHHPAAFLAGVLTHDPGMYPKRLILDDARSLGIAVLGLDINASAGVYRIEALAEGERAPHVSVHPDLPDASGYGIRLSLGDVSGISGAEVARIEAGAPYVSLADFVRRAGVSLPVTERIILAGGFDSIYDIEPLPAEEGFVPQRRARHVPTARLGRRGRVTRRDLLVHLADLDRWSRSVHGGRSGPRKGGLKAWGNATDGYGSAWSQAASSAPQLDIATRAARQSQAAAPIRPTPTQLLLDLGDTPVLTQGNGLPELTGPERVRAELDILGLDASAHVVDFYAPMLDALGVTRARDLLEAKTTRPVWVAGVKVATQTPPVRSGRRVVFLTVDDGTGPADATFFEDVQGPYAATVFHSWLLLVRGQVRRTGPRGVSIRATGAWELTGLWDAWRGGGTDAVLAALAQADALAIERAAAVEEAAIERPTGRRVLVHASGFRQSPYADVRPAGPDVRGARSLAAGGTVPDEGVAPRKLWHASPGSAGH